MDYKRIAFIWSKLTLFLSFTSLGCGNQVATYKEDTDSGSNLNAYGKVVGT